MRYRCVSLFLSPSFSLLSTPNSVFMIVCGSEARKLSIWALQRERMTSTPAWEHAAGTWHPGKHCINRNRSVLPAPPCWTYTRLVVYLFARRWESIIACTFCDGGTRRRQRKGEVLQHSFRPVSTHSHALNVLGFVSRIYRSEGKELKRANSSASVTWELLWDEAFQRSPKKWAATIQGEKKSISD